MTDNTTAITASMLYDFVACPHRVSMDTFADPADRDEVSPFVQLLWYRGQAHEQAVVAEIDMPVVDLSEYQGAEREARTLDAIQRGEPLISNGRITADDLLGSPDLLCKEPSGYAAGDIKSGVGGQNSKSCKKFP